MAVVPKPCASLLFIYQIGFSPTGAPVTRIMIVNDIDCNAPKQAVFEAAYALFSLSDCPLLDVYYRRPIEFADED